MTPPKIPSCDGPRACSQQRTSDKLIHPWSHSPAWADARVNKGYFLFSSILLKLETILQGLYNDMLLM